MNVVTSAVFRAAFGLCMKKSQVANQAQQRTIGAWARPWTPQAEPPWHYQQVRTVKRGTEYQPKNIKRKRTHGWIKRISTQGGIEVILRRMLKGRKSLSH
ncbi:large ribosomal subunit protein bL34m [Denticeps clupeoides]|uniref:large ribosomal subunit protein bL34m n=1 Tax=Denticeps clupeoides TaxID=299321 RepID=UPI0010A51948|nr:39S ribosomal protein L34, mitochondrial [Denticeps clupeoides]